MTGDKLLSVCCLGYKHAPFIKDCISSIWQGNWGNTEIVAMDDGSNDGSVEILKELRSQSPFPFKIIEQQNSGNIPANFNKLFRESRGEYVIFTSLDDFQLPGMLAERMDRLVANPKLAFAANTQCFALEGERTLVPEPSTAYGVCPEAKILLDLEYSQFHSFYIQACIFRRDVIQAVGGFSENMLGDDIVLRTKILFWLLANPEYSFVLLNEPGFVYRRHPGNVSQNVLRQIELAFQYCDKFWKTQPFPMMMKCWLQTGLETLPYEKMIEVFAKFQRAPEFLKDADIKKALQLCAVKSFAIEHKGQDVAI